MAEGKKSFLLYADVHHTVKHLSTEQAGELFKHLLSYVNDENPETDNPIVKIAFEPIKQSLKRDLKKYEKTKGDKSVAGITGNLKRWYPDIYDDYQKEKITLKEAQELALSRKESQCDNSVAEIAVNDSDSGSENDSVTESEIKINNNYYLENAKKSSSWIETAAMQSKVSPETVKQYLDQFSDHLVLMEEQKKNDKDFKQHFIHWFKKQDLSHVRNKPVGRSNQINYGR